ncbi:MAG: hypothetical protein L0H29_11285 [Sinobacteraceae bacterium]|nr:hypothetical protein [Nevskiaceae bacterium]
MKWGPATKRIALLVIGVVAIALGAAAISGCFDIVLHNTYQPLTIYDQALVVRQRHDLVRWAGFLSVIAGLAMALGAFHKRR